MDMNPVFHGTNTGFIINSLLNLDLETSVSHMIIYCSNQLHYHLFQNCLMVCEGSEDPLDFCLDARDSTYTMCL